MTDDNRRKMLKFRAWRRGFREMDLLMGSFAETVMRESHLPLLIIRSQQDEAE